MCYAGCIGIGVSMNKQHDHAIFLGLMSLLCMMDVIDVNRYWKMRDVSFDRHLEENKLYEHIR